MRKWELLAVVIALTTVVGTPLATFGYQAYRKFRLGPEAVPVRVPSFSPPAGDALAGRQVFLNHCAVCHGQDAHGKIGPDLHNVAAFGPTFLYAFVSNPETVNNQATMPRVPLAQQELADVVAYLVALPDLPPDFGSQNSDLGSGDQSNPKSELRTPNSETGRRLFQSKGCVACHGPEAQGTDLAPNLAGKTADVIRHQVRQPKEKMPPFSTEQLSDSELEAIIQYIESLSR